MKEEPIKTVNEYVNSLRWMDFEFKEINVFHSEEQSSQIRILGGEDIDLDGYETIEIIFHDVSYINAFLLIRYEASKNIDFLSVIKNEEYGQYINFQLEQGENLYKIASSTGDIIIVAKQVSNIIHKGVK